MINGQSTLRDRACPLQGAGLRAPSASPAVAPLFFAFFCLYPVHPVHPAESSPAQVPQALLARLTAQYVPEDDKNGDTSETDKIRRYRAILREGAWAERQYPAAGDLYRVRELMLAAARGLTALEGMAENGSTLMGIVRRLADSNAPPEARLPADVLLFRARIDELGNAVAEAAEELDLFVDRYARTSAAASALMAAVQLGKIAGTRNGRRIYLARLARTYYAQAGVTEFLQAEGMDPYHGRLMPARLTKLDGGTIRLPRDTMGKLTVLHFWSMERSGLGSRRWPAGSMKPSYDRLHGRGVEFVGINLDTDTAKVRQFVKAEDLPWPQTCSGLGAADPVFRRYRVPTLPAWWLVGPDGRAISSSYTQGDQVQHWGSFGRHVESMLGLLRETMARGPHYRSGEFLLDVPQVLAAGSPAPAAGDVPADQLASIREKVFVPPSLGLWPGEKAESLREGLVLARAAVRKHPKAANLSLVRNWALVAAKWLASEDGNAACANEARQIASALVAGGAAGGARLLADYVLASAELADAPADRSAGRIEAFRRAYARTDVSWAADTLAVMLAIECGDEETRVELVRALAERASDQPKVRGFLRDFCCANVDARTSQLQYQPLCTMAGGGDSLPNEPHPVRAVLPRLDGGAFRLPEDARGRLVLLHFWSTAFPPVPLPLVFHPWKQPARDLASNVVVVDVNMDRSRADVEMFLKDNGQYAGWVHVFSGKGADDPLARELDVCALPRTVLIDRSGTIYRWGTPVQLGDAVLRAALIPPGAPGGPPATAPASPPPPPAPATTAKPPDVPATAAPPDDLPKELTLGLGGKTTLKLALVTGGDFRMGPTAGEVRRYDDDLSQRLITITRPFYMGIHPVTRGQFASFVQDANYTTQAEQAGWAFAWSGSRWEKVAGACWRKCGFEQDDDHPVVCVSFDDAVEFCGWLSRRSGRNVRIPTEAQWEYACRAGTNSVFLWGDDPNGGEGWCNGADASAAKRQPLRMVFPWDDGFAFTSPVGRFRPNALGLYDMVGNAWQWTGDWFDLGFRWGHQWRTIRYDPTGASAGSHKAVRGGSWMDGPAGCRSAARRPEPPGARLNILGFRVAADAPSVTPPSPQPP